MKTSLLSLGIRLAWLRISGPLQRLGVLLRYEGFQAASQAVRNRIHAKSAPDSITTEMSQMDEGTTEAIVAKGAEPVVSVVVRTHDRPFMLRQALTDLSHQSYGDFEVILVNDGDMPLDDLVADFQALLPLIPAEHTPGTGRAAALNSGLQQARGRFVTYLDDDDRVYPGHLRTLMDALAEGAAAAYSRAEQTLCWSDGREDRVVARKVCVSRPFELRSMLVDNWIPFMTLMHRRDCTTKSGLFDAGLELFEDWDFLIRLGRGHQIVHVPDVTCEYRYRFGPIPDRARSAVTDRRRTLAATRRIYERYPVTDDESRARRRLTLNALRRDVEEVAWIEATVQDPLLRDLRVVAWAARFPQIRQYKAELKRPGSVS